MIKYVIWDFNGTILDDKQLSLDLLNVLLDSENKPPLNMQQYLDVFGFPIKEYYLKSGLTFIHRSFEEMAEWYIVEYQPASLKLSLMPNLKNTLKELKNRGIKNICLSASKQSNLEEQLKHFKIDHYFDAILGTENIVAKGKKDVGLNYLKENNINPSHCLLVGDTNEDYRVANHLGSKVVLFSGGHQSVERLKKISNLIIHDLYDILKLI